MAVGDASQMHDLRTDPGLRESLIDLTHDGGWNGPAGRAVLYEFRRLADAIARRAFRGSDIYDPHLVDDLVSVAWEVAHEQTSQVIGADRPWAYVASAMTRAAATEIRAAELLTAPRAARDLAGQGQRTARRLGSSAAWLDSIPPRHIDAAPLRQWNPALRALHSELIRAGAPTVLAAEAIDMALDVLQLTLRRSWLHHTAYRDARLGASLSRTQVRALMDLLIGSRRDGPDGSAWLALRRAVAVGRQPTLAEVHPQSLPKVRALASAWSSRPS